MPAKRKSRARVRVHASVQVDSQEPSAFKPHTGVADQVADGVINHVDTQYPAMWNDVPKTARVSLRNFVYNQVLMAVGNAWRDAETHRRETVEVVRVDAVGDRCMTVTRAQRPGKLAREDEARSAAARGEFILAIKILNNANGLTLKEAKDIVESWKT